MEYGVVKLADAISTSSSTTAEEMKAYVVGVAEKVCEVTGLSIIKTEDLQYGAVCFIGGSGEENPIMAILNGTAASSFYKTIIFSRVTHNDEYYTTTSSGKAYADSYISTRNLYMKYAKSENGLILGFITGASQNVTTAPLFYVGKIANESEEESVCLGVNSGSILSSYAKLLGNTGADTVTFTTTLTKTIPLLPESANAMIDIYLQNDTKLKGAKLYSNKELIAPWGMISVAGEKYMIFNAASASSWSVALKMS